MKKLKTIVLLLLITMFAISPAFTGLAEEKKEVYYPVGINDYVDLNNISNFAIYNNQIFYTKDNQHVICYDKTTKTSTELVQNVNQGTIKNIQVAGEYVFVFNSMGSTFAYKLSDLSTVEFSNSPIGNLITVHYVNNKYYFGYIKTSSSNYFVLDCYSTIGGSKTTITSAITFNYEIFSSKIVFGDNLIAIKPLTGQKIYLIKDYTTADELTLLESNAGTYHGITGFNANTKILDIAILNFENDTYSNRIFIGYEGSTKTQICNFNGLKLTYEDDNNIVSDKLSVYNNSLYIYNKTNADINICNYNNQTNELVKQQLFLAGKGVEEGRFKDVDELTYKSGTYYATDTGNNRIQVLNQNGITTVNNIYGNMTEIVVDNDNNYYYAVYSPGLNASVLYKNGQAISSQFENTKIVSIAINLDNAIYMLSETQIIIFKGRYSITSKTLNSSLNINENSKLRISNNYTNNSTPISGIVDESVYTISIDNKIYTVSIASGNPLSKMLTFEENIIDYKINYTSTNSPIFALLEDGSFVRTSLTESADKNVTIEGFQDYSCFDINVITGELYLYNTQLAAIEKYNNPDFCVKTNMVHYNITAYNHNGFSELWQYTQIKSKALVYDYYNYAGNYIELGEVTNAIVLQVPVDSETGSLGEFAYVAYTLNNRLTFGYVQTVNLVNGIKPMIITDNTYKLRTTAKNVHVYKYPSIFNDFTFYSFAQGDVITTYGKYISSIDNYEYYIVKIGNEYGYICSNDVTLSENITKNIRTNASIKIFDGKEKVNVYLTQDENGTILYKLKDGYKINVSDYNKNEKFTKITFIDEDQQEREGYVLTSYVKLAGLSTTVLTAIVLLVLDAIIAVIVIVFYHHYKKKQRENSKD